jgi:hypothetical protein
MLMFSAEAATWFARLGYKHAYLHQLLVVININEDRYTAHARCSLPGIGFTTFVVNPKSNRPSSLSRGESVGQIFNLYSDEFRLVRGDSCRPRGEIRLWQFCGSNAITTASLGLVEGLIGKLNG